MPQLQGLSFIEDRIVVVARASEERDHGKPFWLCERLPPLERAFMHASTTHDAAAWMRQECGAQQVWCGVEVAAAVGASQPASQGHRET